MSIDKLQEKIRKEKNPSMVAFSVLPDHIPPHITVEEGSRAKALGRFCLELMAGLKGRVPSVRFDFGMFALLGQEGVRELALVLDAAAELGFYVLLDAPELLSPYASMNAAEALCGDDAQWKCDGIVLSSYLGSDIIRPFLPYCENGQKDIFLVARTSNKSAPELQDLLTGSRLVHSAAVDIANRHGESRMGRCGYSHVGAVAAATAPNSLRALRSKYNRIFLLLDGYDYTGANAKNCSYAFDKFGHGAVACAGASVTAAWVQEESDGRDYVAQAAQAAERMKKNLTRYITVL